MQKLIGSILGSVLLFSCADNKADKASATTIDTSNTSTTALPAPATIQQLQLVPGAFQQVDSLGSVMVPLMLPSKEKGGIEFSSDYSRGASQHAWNIVFYNTNTGQIRLLEENRKMLILSFDYKQHIRTAAGRIFYEIITQDFNKDGHLDTEDPTYLFVSNSDGTGFRQLSPINVKLINWELVPKTSLVLMRGLTNSNGDEELDEKDEMALFQIDYNKATSPGEIIPKAVAEQWKTTFWKQWGKKDE